jgi:hypothetical protein
MQLQRGISRLKSPQKTAKWSTDSTDILGVVNKAPTKSRAQESSRQNKINVNHTEKSVDNKKNKNGIKTEKVGTWKEKKVSSRAARNNSARTVSIELREHGRHDLNFKGSEVCSCQWPCQRNSADCKMDGREHKIVGKQTQSKLICPSELDKVKDSDLAVKKGGLNIPAVCWTLTVHNLSLVNANLVILQHI